MLEFFRKLFFQQNRDATYRPAADEFDIEYNRRAKARQDEIDRILDKISAKGMGSLSKKEQYWLAQNTAGKPSDTPTKL
ncbi:MAG: hypothetical protein LBS94_01910 [Prevotellaceae bacterium]|jgi:hypothetical protein|nr:hypothetical protein [Prevotellaceae bacterium]